jgi:CTD kinase subunit beta
MAPEQKQDSNNPPGSDVALPEPPPIHPSFIQVAKPYIFEQTIQKCMASMAINPLREDNLRLQGVTWIDNVRRELNLYVKCPLFPRRFANDIGPFGLLTPP